MMTDTIRCPLCGEHYVPRAHKDGACPICSMRSGPPVYTDDDWKSDRRAMDSGIAD